MADYKRPEFPPAEKPPFSVSELKAAIPKHCFERSLFWSFGYLAWDLFIVVCLFRFALEIPSYPVVLQLALWPAYWLVQGCVMTGIWVIGHECGHQAFSASQTVNYAVGLVIHTALLVPFHSWRISHAKHHAHTSNMDHDEVFVPSTRSDMMKAFGEVQPSVAKLCSEIFLTLTVGWPAYLTANISGPKKFKGASHFNPKSPIFNSRQEPDIVTSDVALGGFVALLGYLCYEFGTLRVAALYFVPYLVVNFWLVLITYLQHSDEIVAHYRNREWTWLRGALATVDRDFGVLNVVFHHITDTHVLHHLFSHIPHYHAQEATEAIKKVIGKYYLYDSTPIAPALWRSWNKCRFVEDTGEVVFYKSK